jgi:hypothetical protein
MANTKLENQVINHLEYLGYEVRDAPDLPAQEGTQLLRADRKPFEGINIILFEGMVNFDMWYPLNDSAITDRQGLLEVVNDLNCRSETCYRVQMVSGKLHLWADLTYRGLYDKEAFAQFVSTWERESKALRRTEIAEFAA